MYRRDGSVALRGSSAPLYNNLSVLRPPHKPAACLGTVHGHAVTVVTAGGDAAGSAQRQLQPRAGGGASLVTQAAWCVLPARILLVLTCQKGIEMYESDGSIMVYWHALDVTEHPPGKSAAGTQSGAPWEHKLCLPEGSLQQANVSSAWRPPSTSSSHPCAGMSSGMVLVFDIPHKGTNITVSEVLKEHHDPITDIAAELGQAPDGAGDLVTADDAGTLCVWGSAEDFALLTRIPGFGWTCSSVKLWNGLIAAGYGSGQIRLYEAGTGALRAEVSAHARWIYALDLAPATGQLLSGAEDSFVHVWKICRNPDTDDVEMEHCHAECVTDTQICGARFCDPDGNSFAVTGYDLSEIFRYSRV
ncbi:hypothetical protein ASZ78_015153 [Callipepla squamata]|uniref:WD repeat-containing protein 54 beta-propeller domain-containing protein n=1 Tax=Callipepla squamata TaxID=9009 RepID=A0A226MCF9_CALSU|nr:hypothetical protein ASZ78_015153 [Callipepla squamata]